MSNANNLWKKRPKKSTKTARFEVFHEKSEKSARDVVTFHGFMFLINRG